MSRHYHNPEWSQDLAPLNLQLQMTSRDTTYHYRGKHVGRVDEGFHFLGVNYPVLQEPGRTCQID